MAFKNYTYYDASGKEVADVTKATRYTFRNPAFGNVSALQIDFDLPKEGEAFLVGGTNANPLDMILGIRQGGRYTTFEPAGGGRTVRGAKGSLLSNLGIDINKIRRFRTDIIGAGALSRGETITGDPQKLFPDLMKSGNKGIQQALGQTNEQLIKQFSDIYKNLKASVGTGSVGFKREGGEGTNIDLTPAEIAAKEKAAGRLPSPPTRGDKIEIPFTGNLNPDQKDSISTLVKNKPDSSKWTPEDKANWNFATGNSPLPGAPGAVPAPAAQPEAKKGDQTTVSIVDYLTSINQNNSFSTRAILAREAGILNYTGTAEQNTRLLRILREQEGAEPAPEPEPEAEPEIDVDEIGDIDLAANADQDDELRIIESEAGEDVDLSTSAGLIKTITELLESKKGDQEKELSLVELFEQKRKELGLGDLEDELVDLDTQLEKLDADYASTIEGEEIRRVAVGQIRRRQSAQEIEYNRLKRDLTADRNSVANQLNMKYSNLSTLMTLTGMDYTNAQSEYHFQFNAAIQLTNLLKGIEDSAKTDAERKTDNARANLQIMINLITNGDINYDDLDASAKVNIRNMEIQSGLPAGFTSFITKELEAPVISFLTAYTNSAGRRIQPVATKNADGTFEIKNVDIGQDKLVGAGGSKITQSMIDSLIASGHTDVDYSMVGKPVSLLKGKDIEGAGDNFANARQFIEDNPRATESELKSGLQENTELTDGEINTMIANRKIPKLTPAQVGLKIYNAIVVLKQGGFKKKDALERIKREIVSQSESLEEVDDIPPNTVDVIEEQLDRVYF